MVLVVLSLLCNNDTLILKLYQKKIATLMKGGFFIGIFIGRFIVGTVPGMINKEVLAQLIYKSA